LARQAFEKADRKGVNLFGGRRLMAGADKRLADALREDALAAFKVSDQHSH
jgi:hypothetical protein